MRTLLSSVLISAILVGGAAGQALPGGEAGNSIRTRAELERLLEEYEQALASPAYSQSVKRNILADADAVRGRLTNGDFRVGDRIVLYVEGEPEVPDTVQVQPGPTIALPLFGEISLQGVLRSEITGHLTEALSRFIRDPVVRANGLMRLSIQGAVGQPGFYTIPAEMLVGEALMVARGPSPQANVDDIRIERGARPLLEGEALQDVIRAGLTLDQLNLQAGDQIVVGERNPSQGLLRNAATVVGLLASVTTLVIIFSR